MLELTDLAEGLDLLCPMYLVADGSGEVCKLGPTLQSLLGDGALGVSLHNVVEFLGLGEGGKVPTGQRLQARLTSVPDIILTGIMAPIGPYKLFNFSFGLNAIDAVARFSLTNSNFAPTDQTINMLYLAEAKSLALEEFRRLSMRLDGARHAAEKRASTDALTGLPNRRGLEAFLTAVAQTGDGIAALQIDLDYFKAVNDLYGHAAGDFVLAKAAETMRREVRKTDILARTGGDEFTLILTPPPKKQMVCDLADRLIRRLEMPVEFEGNTCKISASVGIVHATDLTSNSLSSVFNKGDKALYAAKKAGRGRFVLAENC